MFPHVTVPSGVRRRSAEQLGAGSGRPPATSTGPAARRVRPVRSSAGPAKREHRRPGAGDDRRHPVRRAARSTRPAVRGIAGARYRWCSRSSVAGEQQPGVGGERVHQQRGPAGVAGGVGVRHQVGQQPARPRGGRRAGRHEDDRPKPGMDRQPHRMRGAPRRPSRSRPGSARRAGRRRRCPGGPPARRRARAAAASSSVSSPPSTSARAASRPATIAAADEPRPRPCGIRFAQTTSQAARLAAERVERRAYSARTTRCRRVRGTLSRALAGDLDVQALVGAPGRRRRRTARARGRARRSRGRGSRWSRAPGPAPDRPGAAGTELTRRHAHETVEAERRGGGLGVDRDGDRGRRARRSPSPGP